MSDLDIISNLIPIVQDFPKKGVSFRDISPLLVNPSSRERAFDLMAQPFMGMPVDYVIGLESRGFPIASALAARLKCGMVMFRKAGKLPGELHTVTYDTEYSVDVMECQKGIINPKSRVLIVDDLLATGGSAGAAAKLVRLCGASVIGFTFLVELEEFHGREKLTIACQVPIYSLIPPKVDLGIRAIASNTCSIGNLKRMSTDPIVLLSHPSSQVLADRIIECYPWQFVKGSVTWKRFPDGYPDVIFDAEILANKRVVFIGSLYNLNNFVEQVSLAMVLPRQLCRSVDVVFPYYAPATMERVEKEGILATAETMAKMISCPMPIGRSGAAVLRIVDIHAIVERFYFSDQVIVRLSSHLPAVLEHMTTNNGNKFCVAFPDEGAYKRFRTLIPNTVPMIVCSKVREGDKRIVKIMDKVHWTEGQELNHVLIVDDLVQTGGTLHECRMALQNYGAKTISASVTHAIFPDRCYTRFMKGGDREGFQTFYISDSVPEIAEIIKNQPPFKMLSLATQLGQDLIKM